MTEMTYRELRSDLADALNRVQYRSETITITRRGKAVARIVPIEENAMSKQDLADQVRTYLDAGDHGDDYDVDGIVEEIGERYGRDLVSVDEISTVEWSAILYRHDKKA